MEQQYFSIPQEILSQTLTEFFPNISVQNQQDFLNHLWIDVQKCIDISTPSPTIEQSQNLIQETTKLSQNRSHIHSTIPSSPSVTLQTSNKYKKRSRPHWREELMEKAESARQTNPKFCIQMKQRNVSKPTPYDHLTSSIRAVPTKQRK